MHSFILLNCFFFDSVSDSKASLIPQGPSLRDQQVLNKNRLDHLVLFGFVTNHYWTLQSQQKWEKSDFELLFRESQRNKLTTPAKVLRNSDASISLRQNLFKKTVLLKNEIHSMCEKIPQTLEL